MLSLSEPAGSGTTQNGSPAGSRRIHQECTRCTRSGAKSFQPGDLSGQVVGVDIQVHPARAVAEPLDEQPDVLAVQRGAMVFGVTVALGQLLAGGCAPKRQLAVVFGRRDINHDLGQPAVVRVGADNAFTSCDLRILADEAPEPIASSNADAVVSRRDVRPAVGRFLAEGPVRPVGVVVVDVFAEDVVQMSPAGDEDAVGALAPRAGYPPLADRIGPRRPDWRCDDPHAGRGEDGVERVGVFGIPVSDQELQIVGALTEVHQRVPGLLCRPCGGGVGGDAGQVDAAIVMLDDEQHIEPAEEDGVGVEEVGRCDRLGLGGQELPPAVGPAPRRGADAGGLEDLPDGGGRDLVPQTRQLAADPPVAQVGLSRAISSTSRRIVGPVRGRPGVRCR